ncbi:hypothetical protein GCM10009809_38660 [Isoptericola hypogeus]|uniref:UPF0033 domain-containing protein n=1 Tax=Isoptericola hypogeus TaxID=300179 RepID=A0ABN2JUP7_9MICO
MTEGIPGGAEVVVDARGLRCPLPVIRLAARARDLPPGALLSVLTSDPAARHDVPAWARMRGHAVVGEEPVGEEQQDEDADVPCWRLTVRLGPAS